MKNFIAAMIIGIPFIATGIIAFPGDYVFYSNKYTALHIPAWGMQLLLLIGICFVYWGFKSLFSYIQKHRNRPKQN